MDKLYTVNEVAIVLNVTSNTVRLWLNKGMLKGIKISNGWRISETDLKAFTNRGDNTNE